MKRTVIGFSLLLLLLIGGMLSQRALTAAHTPTARALEAAAHAALEEDWAEADKAAARAAELWGKSWKFTATLADHQPMEDIDALFVRLEAYTAARDSTEYAAACRELARRLDAISDAHSLRWWNVL